MRVCVCRRALRLACPQIALLVQRHATEVISIRLKPCALHKSMHARLEHRHRQLDVRLSQDHLCHFKTSYNHRSFTCSLTLEAKEPLVGVISFL